MPSKYQIIVAMAADEAKSIVSNADRYMALLILLLDQAICFFAEYWKSLIRTKSV